MQTPTEPVLETQLAPAPATPERSAGAVGPRFTVGGVVSRTMSAWWRHAVAFALMSMVANAAMLVWLWALFQRIVPGRGFEQQETMRLLAYLPLAWSIAVVLSVVLFGAVTYGTVRHLRGERASVGDMLRAGVRRGFPVVATGFLVWLAIFAGMILLVVPGIIVAVATSVAIPAAVVERPGVIGAISRSFALTRGRRWRLFGAWLTLLCIVWLLAAVVQLATTVVGSLAFSGQPGWVLVASQLGNALFSAIPVVGMAVAYHDLRVEAEGVDTAELAKVFE